MNCTGNIYPGHFVGNIYIAPPKVEPIVVADPDPVIADNINIMEFLPYLLYESVRVKFVKYLNAAFPIKITGRKYQDEFPTTEVTIYAFTGDAICELVDPDGWRGCAHPTFRTLGDIKIHVNGDGCGKYEMLYATLCSYPGLYTRYLTGNKDSILYYFDDVMSSGKGRRPYPARPDSRVYEATDMPLLEPVIERGLTFA